MSNHQINQHAGASDSSRVKVHVSVHIQDMLHNMPPISPKRSIFRVHHQLREVNEKAYEPAILAIGPYHYGNGKFKFMEEQKLRYLQHLLNRRQGGSVDIYVQKVGDLEQEARNYYAETIDLSQEQFLEMMLIDGCFIVELLLRNLERKRDRRHYLNDPLSESNWLQYRLRRDLLLLENQLPLFVLRELYELTKDPDESLNFNAVAIEYLDYNNADQNWTSGRRRHLLHLYYAWCTRGLPPKNLRTSNTGMPSAIELMESGVTFLAMEGRRLGDIKFKNGTLEIPILTVEDNTESEFRNLIAFEQHGQSRPNNYFSDYADFMDCLINSSKDVEVLRHEKIIQSYLGDDKVIAQMFNKMGDNVISSFSYYSEIVQDLNAHSGKRMNVWMVKLWREYFHTPWATLSIVAAIVLLLLTAAQTVFTIVPSTKQS